MFGQHIKTFTFADEEAAVAWQTNSNPKVKERRIETPQADEPWWWPEYLMEAWKLEHNVDQPHRDARTRMQRADDEWQREKVSALRSKWTPLSTDMPKHDIYGRKET